MIRTPTGLNPYDYEYTYDLAGNRLTKLERHAGMRLTEYTYDVSNPGLYGSQGNRLMSSKT